MCLLCLFVASFCEPKIFLEIAGDWFFRLGILEKTDDWRSGGQAGGGPWPLFLHFLIRGNPR